MGNSIYYSIWLSSGFLPVVLHSDQPLSEGEIIPFSVYDQAALSTPERGGFTLTDRLLFDATDDDQRQHHHAEHHFQL